MSTKELLDAWSISSIDQVIAAEKTYEDLKLNIDSIAFLQRINELQDYLDAHPNDRLKVRIKIYEILGFGDLNQKFKNQGFKEKIDLAAIESLMPLALKLNDDLLLATVYTLHAEQGLSEIEDRLYYLNKVVEIQSKYGSQYFPQIFRRQYFLSHIHYSLEEYQEAEKFGLLCLENLKSPKVDLGIYCLSKDILGLSQYKLGKIEEGIDQYSDILTTLQDYKDNFKAYKSNYTDFDKFFYEVWEGVAKGNLARGYIMQNDHKEEALALLESNISSSMRHDQFSDLCKAYYLKSLILLSNQEIRNGIKLLRKAFELSVENFGVSIKLDVTNKLSESYASINQFDSAYFFNRIFETLKNEKNDRIFEKKLINVQNRLLQDSIKAEVEEARLELDRQKNLRNLSVLIGAIISLLIALIYVIYRYKQKVKFKALEADKREKELELEKKKTEYEQAQIQIRQFKLKIAQNTLINQAIEKSTDSKNSVITELKNSTILTEEEWQVFKDQFSKVYPGFIFKLTHHYDDITQGDIRFLCLCQLNLENQEIASALGINASSLRVTWYRLRNKIGLDKSVSPNVFINQFFKEPAFVHLNVV